MNRRIFLTLAANASSGYSDLMYRYIFYDTLVRMGHDVVFYPYHEAMEGGGNKRPINLKAVSEKIYDQFISHHRKKPFDLFLSYYHGGQADPELFRRVREMVPCINYTTNFHQVHLYEPLLKAADLSIYVSRDAGPYFEQKGFKGYYMPFAGLSTNLQFNRNKNGRIIFTGTSYGPRANYLWRCLQKGLPVDIYGTHWTDNHRRRAVLRTLKLEALLLAGKDSAADTAYRCLNDLILKEISEKYPQSIHGPLPDSEYHRILTEASVVLNFPESRHGHDFSNPNVLIGANLRDFEVPVAGSLLLTQDNAEIRTFFEPGQEIVTFANEWELTDKARFYTEHPDLVLKIAEAGMKRAAAEHLWEHRFSALIAYLEQNYL